jgi:multisubunit Na+/H+ antiporter MnhE subunit
VLRAWLTWWLLLFALWLAVDDNDDWAELALGGVCAAIAATAAVLVRRERRVLLRPRRAWLRAVPRAFARAVADVPSVARAVWRRGVLRRPETGRIVEVPFAATGDDPEQAARRVLAAVLGSVSPGTVVIGVDADRRVLRAHRLTAGGDAVRDADPLSAVDPQGGRR